MRHILLFSAILGASATTTAAPGPTPAEPDLCRRLDAAVDSLDQAGRFSGVVMLSRSGAPVYQRAVGFADREARRRNQPGTRFNLGSINKAFTATAIRQLAAGGKIALDSPLQFEPGTSQRYSNAGYVVLGRLVERVSGEDYYDYVRRHIYQPAGMTATAHTPVADLASGTAIGDTRGAPDAPADAPVSPNTALLPARGSAAGGGYSTAGDLLRFVQALREGRIVGGAPPRASPLRSAAGSAHRTDHTRFRSGCPTAPASGSRPGSTRSFRLSSCISCSAESGGAK